MKTENGSQPTTRKGFIQRDRRRNIVLLLVIVLIAAIAVAILSLLSKQYTRYRDTEDHGMGRAFMFPFVFTDSEGILRIIPNGSMKVLEIDDTVTTCVHDAKQDLVYYIRENCLYQYTIQENTRREIVGNVSQFLLSENRNAIFLIDTMQNVKYYDGQNCIVISKAQSRPEQFYSMGKNELLFLEDYRSEDETAVLCKVNEQGKVMRYDFRVDAEKDFRFSLDGKKICYYSENAFCIAKTDGTLLAEFEDSVPVFETQQPMIQGGTNKTLVYNRSIPVHYIVSSVSAASSRTLLYFDGVNTKQIATGVEEILYYSHDTDMILYTTVNQKGEKTVYQSSDGNEAEAQISCDKEAKFLFAPHQDYLYYQLPDGTLYRYNIYDVDRKSVKIAEDTGLLYLYPNKPFIVYASTDASKMYLVHSDNTIEQYPAETQWRLYGEHDYQYLMMRTNGANRVSLDFVNLNNATRISGNVAGQVFFGKDIEYVLYTSMSSLYAWHDGVSREICEIGEITAAPIVA